MRIYVFKIDVCTNQLFINGDEPQFADKFTPSNCRHQSSKKRKKNSFEIIAIS